MKLRIFLRSFGAPILLGILLPLNIAYNDKPFDTFGDIIFFASILLLALLSETNFIKGVRREENRLVIDYFTRFLQSKTIDFDITSIEGIKLSKWRRYNIWSPTLRLQLEGAWRTFAFVSKQEYDHVQEQLSLTEPTLVR